VNVIVQKYGGTSVGDPERIKRVAQRVVATADAGHQVCVVVSAMGAMTDQLLDLAGEVSKNPTSTRAGHAAHCGERISSALLAMAVIELGRDAVSLTGSQAGIVTDERHGKARIVELRPQRVLEALELGKIVIIAGFQGISGTSDITTLGRGGSDTTAVAVAAGLDAGACEIYTDVDGVFTADPRVVPTARKLASVTYEEMLELAASGAKVLALVRSSTLERTASPSMSARRSARPTAPGS
jgi:Aspartokinases